MDGELFSIFLSAMSLRRTSKDLKFYFLLHLPKILTKTSILSYSNIRLISTKVKVKYVTSFPQLTLKVNNDFKK